MTFKTMNSRLFILKNSTDFVLRFNKLKSDIKHVFYPEKWGLLTL